MASPLGSAPPAVRDRRPVLVEGPPEPLSALLGGLCSAVLEGAGPEALVERASDLLGLPVAWRAPDLRVRAWAAPAVFGLTAPPALPSSALDAPAVRPLVAGLGPRRPSVVLPPAPTLGLSRRHLLAVLVVDGRVAGHLDVGELGRSLCPADSTVVEQVAAMLVLVLSGEARAHRVLALTRDDVLADLVRGTRPAADLRRLAARVGLDLATAHVLVRYPVAPGVAAVDCRGAVVTALTGVTGRTPPVHLEPDAVVGIVGMDGEAAPGDVRALRERLRGALGPAAAATGLRRVVVSGVVRDPDGFPAALAATQEVDGIVSALGGTAEVVDVDEFGTLRLVVNADRTGAALRFAEQNLGPLRRSDESSGGDLVETLRHYLAAGAQVRASATALGVHENTVRYRLGRIQHITGLDMRRFDALLVAQLAFQIEGLAHGRTGDVRPGPTCGTDSTGTLAADRGRTTKEDF